MKALRTRGETGFAYNLSLLQFAHCDDLISSINANCRGPCDRQVGARKRSTLQSNYETKTSEQTLVSLGKEGIHGRLDLVRVYRDLERIE